MYYQYAWDRPVVRNLPSFMEWPSPFEIDDEDYQTWYMPEMSEVEIVASLLNSIIHRLGKLS